MSSSQIQVLLIPYPNFNTLDLNGPLEILGNLALKPSCPSQPSPFKITIAAADDLTQAVEGIKVARTITLPQARSRLADFDVLIQPGGGTDSIVKDGTNPLKLMPGLDALAEIAAAFAKLKPLPNRERVAMSICTGALIFGYAGVFDGLTATTHFRVLDKLREICQEYVARTPEAKGTTVLPKDTPTPSLRYVDAGLNASGVRVISSGGISCGLDATLYLVSRLLGHEEAVKVAQMMEYAWREM